MKQNYLIYRKIFPFLMLFLIGQYAFGQSMVTGKVTSQEDGQGLPGVSVSVKGTTSGTITDVDGNYSLNVSSPDAILVFSSVGFTTEEIPVGSRTKIDLEMVADIKQLSEIVVVGYGTQKKSDLTGSVISADIESFKESPNVNILQSLQGSVPGINIGQVNQAGEEPSILIRGRSTINGNQDALIVVDGIIFRGRLADINPADIKSVDILKDASSKAIYGAQAANGVILITTKGGGNEARKPVISYSGSISTQSPTVDARLLNRDEVLQKIKDVEYKKAYLGPDYTQPNPDFDFTQTEMLPPLLNGVESGNAYDWWGALTSPGFINNHLLSVSGGTDATNFYISGGFTEQNGFIINDDYSRSSLRINLDTKINDWLTIGANTFGSFTDFSGSYPNMGTLARTSPLVNPKDENGEFIVNHLGDNIVNPFLNAQADNQELKNRLSGILYGLIKIPYVEGLTYRLNYSNNYNWHSTFNSNIYSAGRTGAASKAYASTLDMMLDNIVNYDKQFGKHGINATAVYGYNKVTYDRTGAEGENYPNLDLSYHDLSLGINQFITSDAWEQISIYQMGRISYNYNSKYLITATVRRDGFSGFAKNKKFAVFPSVGLGWVLSEESFVDIPKVDFLKLRVSYGENGNLVNRYSSLARVSAGDGSKYVFGDGAPTSPGQTVASLANPNLSWEKTIGYNFGLDFDMFNSRISGNIEYYNSTTNDLLWNMTLPQMTGFNNITTNLGEIRNNGLEVLLKTMPIQKTDFNWNLDFNFATNNNKINTLTGEDVDGDGKEDDLVANGLFIGRSLGTVYGYDILGVWQVTDDIPTGFAPGTYKLRDVDGDGDITPEKDRVFLGSTDPAYTFGVQNTLTYKNFSLRFFINSIQGGKNGYLGRNHTDGIAGTSGTAQNSNWFTFYDYWSPTNPDGKYSLPWVASKVSPARYMSRSFVRLQDISLSYMFSNSLIEKIGLDNLKLFVSGKNVLTFTNWEGWDPETEQGVGNTVDRPGTDNDDYAFPLMRSFTIGLDVSF